MHKTTSFKKKVLTAAIASAATAASFSGMTYAQDSSVEEVVVTGIRASLEASVDTKRNSAGVVDAISAEDIGKFPDSNLAESLQRITGVSIDRRNGEGFQVTVRGFGPQYNLITLNGRSMPAGQIGAEGNLINQRSFDMSNIASEGVSGIEVFKTGKANVASGGIGSTINLKTRRPLDDAGVHATVGVKALNDTTNRSGDEITPEVSSYLSWTDENEMFGASLSFSHQERDSSQAGLRAAGWNNNAGPWRGVGQIPNGLTTSGVVINAPALGTMTNFPNGPSYYRADFERERENAQVTLQYRPVENVTATLDYTTAEQQTIMQRSGTSFWFGGGAFPTDAVVFSGGDLGGGDDAVSPLLWWAENPTRATRDIAHGVQYGNVQNNLDSTGLNVEWEVNERFKMEFDVASSSTESLPGDGAIANFYNIGLGVQGAYAQGLDYTGDLPLLVAATKDNGLGLVSGEFDVGDVGSTVRQINHDRIWVDLDQAKIEGEFAFTDDIGINFGVESSKMESVQKSSFDQSLMEGGWGVSNPGDVPAGLIHEIDYADYFGDYRTALSDTSRTFFNTAAADLADAPEVFMRGWFPKDVPAIGETLAANAGLVWGPNPVDGTNRKLTEEITAVYVQGDLKFDLGSMPLNVLAGVRYEETDVTSDAYIAATSVTWQGDNDFLSQAGSAASAPLITGTHTYDHLLPSLDVSLGFTEDMIGRASYSQTIARADYDRLSQGVSGIGGPQGGPTILGGASGNATNGNVRLDPLESDNFDLSYEWYFGEASYVSVGYFYKDVPNFIGTESSLQSADNTRDSSNGPRAQRALADLAKAGVPVNQQNLFMMVASYGGPGCVGAACGKAFGSLPYEGANGFENNADIMALPEDPLAILNTNAPVNANGADVDGWEFAVQHFFGETGFGVSANYTLVDGSVTFDNTVPPSGGSQFALVGLSDSANLGLMYEQNGIQARLTYNWREEFLNAANIGSNEPEYTEDYSQVDFNVSYDLTDDLTVSLEGINILGENSRRFGRNIHQARRVEVYGPRYALGARYTF